MLFCRRFSIIALTTPWLATMSATLATTSFAVLSSEVGEGKKKRADDDLSRSEVVGVLVGNLGQLWCHEEFSDFVCGPPCGCYDRLIGNATKL